MNANREYKSSVFTTLFNDTDKLLSLYNAVSGAAVPTDTKIQIATLDDVLFTDRRNDIAFVLDDRVVILAEHQSSVSENMPLRMFIYMATLTKAEMKLLLRSAMNYTAMPSLWEKSAQTKKQVWI